jgi:hypothetical protein
VDQQRRRTNTFRKLSASHSMGTKTLLYTFTDLPSCIGIIRPIHYHSCFTTPTTEQTMRQNHPPPSESTTLGSDRKEAPDLRLLHYNDVYHIE